MDKDCENFGIHEDEYHSIVSRPSRSRFHPPCFTFFAPSLIARVLPWLCVVTYLLSHQVVHCFECNDIIHVNGKVDPTSDIHVIILELIF